MPSTSASASRTTMAPSKLGTIIVISVLLS
jgi:hypothetical protein